MSRIAGIDVHKKALAVVLTETEGANAWEFQRRRVLCTPTGLRELAEWFLQQQVQEVVMESTAQYWQPVWRVLELHFRPPSADQPPAGTLHLAQAQSNRGRRGRKNDFEDAERLVKRLVSEELILSFVPSPQQRLWRTVTRRRTQLMQTRSRLQSQMEGLLEQAHLKLAPLASDLFGVSMIRILKALAKGETNAVVLAALADPNLKATQAQLVDALSACAQWSQAYRVILQQMLEELDLLEKQVAELEKQAAELMRPFQEAVQRLAEMPGMGMVSALQVIAEIGPTAQAFPAAGDLCSWVGVIPGQNITAEQNHSTRSPKGNRALRRLLVQVANAAVKTKGSIFELKQERFRRSMSHKAAIWAVAHFVCELFWIILHKGVRYQERGPAVNAKNQRRRNARVIRRLKAQGYQILPPPQLIPPTV